MTQVARVEMLTHNRLLKIFIFGFGTFVYLDILWAMIPMFIAAEDRMFVLKIAPTFILIGWPLMCLLYLVVWIKRK